MTVAVTILAQKQNRLHSQRLYMESITINREDELFIWVLKANLACIVYCRSQADTAAEADDLRAISKEAVGNSWAILSSILGHKYHQDKIQGDGRKFLDRLKSFGGSQKSSQSLNEVHIYRLQPKSATKGDFFPVYFCLWLFRVGVTDCKWQTKATKCC